MTTPVVVCQDGPMTPPPHPRPEIIGQVVDVYTFWIALITCLMALAVWRWL